MGLQASSGARLTGSQSREREEWDEESHRGRRRVSVEQTEHHAPDAAFVGKSA